MPLLIDDTFSILEAAKKAIKALIINAKDRKEGIGA
jgi:hypothetical protein